MGAKADMSAATTSNVVAAQKSLRSFDKAGGDRVSSTLTELYGSRRDDSPQSQRERTRRSKTPSHRHRSQHRQHKESFSDPSSSEQDSTEGMKKKSRHHGHRRNDRHDKKRSESISSSSIEQPKQEKKHHHKKSRAHRHHRHHHHNKEHQNKVSNRTWDKNDSQSSLTRQRDLKYAPMWTEDIDSSGYERSFTTVESLSSRYESSHDFEAQSPRQQVQEKFKEVYERLDEELLKQGGKEEETFSLDAVLLNRRTHNSGVFYIFEANDKLTMV